MRYKFQPGDRVWFKGEPHVIYYARPFDEFGRASYYLLDYDLPVLESRLS